MAQSEDQKEKNMASMRRVRLHTAITIIKALSARILFIIHMLFAIWAATCVANSSAIWALLSVLGLFVLETIYCIVRRKGQEPKWFSPCTFLYLLTVVPPIWILNLDMFQCFRNPNVNGTCVGISSHATQCALVSLDSYFTRKPLADTLAQIMLLLLILGRWLLPKGNVSREQLSQLLFVYFGISFDIMDLFYLFQERDILVNKNMTYVILTIWTISLFQFTIVLTAVKSRRPRLSLQATPLKRLTSCKCCQFEIWGLLMTVFMQDGPYLILRLYCLIGMRSDSYNLIFYTVKNILVVVLQGYRFVVLLLNCRENYDTDLERSVSMASISKVSRNGVPAKTRPQIGGRSISNLSRGASVNTLNNAQDFSFESVV